MRRPLYTANTSSGVLTTVARKQPGVQAHRKPLDPVDAEGTISPARKPHLELAGLDGSGCNVKHCAGDIVHAKQPFA
ncbi:hypothetical protein [Sedimenticola selenatireducens]|uniref:hypothetical protein n=1 Tax=Sedimenticola selenatireducens TaxID=191960 RepID=UPI002AAAF20B|nr:hypothetical protein [Sedimenticola selenatireducens]